MPEEEIPRDVALKNLPPEYKYNVATDYATFWKNQPFNQSVLSGEYQQKKAMDEEKKRVLEKYAKQGYKLVSEEKLDGGLKFTFSNDGLDEKSTLGSVSSAPMTKSGFPTLRKAGEYFPSEKEPSVSSAPMTKEEIVLGTKQAAIAAGAETRKSRMTELTEQSEQIEKGITSILNPPNTAELKMPMPFAGFFVPIPKGVQGVIAEQVGGLVATGYKEVGKVTAPAYGFDADINPKSIYPKMSKEEYSSGAVETFFTGLSFAAFEKAGNLFLKTKPMDLNVKGGQAVAYDAFNPKNINMQFVQTERGKGEYVMGKLGSRGYSITPGYVSVETSVGELAKLPAEVRTVSITKSVGPVPKGFISAGKTRAISEVKVYGLATDKAKIEFGTEPKVYTPFKTKGEALSLMKRGSLEVGIDGEPVIKYPVISNGKTTIYEYRYQTPKEVSVGLDKISRGKISSVEGGKKIEFVSGKIKGTIFKGNEGELTISNLPITKKGNVLYSSIGDVDAVVFSRREFAPQTFDYLSTPKSIPQSPKPFDVPKFTKFVSSPEVPLTQRRFPSEVNARNTGSIFDINDFSFLAKEKYSKIDVPKGNRIEYDFRHYDVPVSGGQTQVQIPKPEPPTKISSAKFEPPSTNPQIFRLPNKVEGGFRPSIAPPKNIDLFNIKLGDKTINLQSGKQTDFEMIGDKFKPENWMKEPPPKQKTDTKIITIEIPKPWLPTTPPIEPPTKTIIEPPPIIPDINIKFPLPVLIGGFFGGGGGGDAGASKTKGVKGNLKDILSVSKEVEKNIAKNLKGLL